jgi:uncharacterized protein (DUF1810 family)
MPMQSDPFDLNRFVTAQDAVYDQAMTELRAGRKRSHWMWFIFPQVQGLGTSSTAQFYAISGLDETRAYLNHPALGPRLIAAAEALLALKSGSAIDVLGSPDDMKLRSSATLFAEASTPASVFHRLLDRFFGGAPDPKTLELLRNDRGVSF